MTTGCSHPQRCSCETGLAVNREIEREMAVFEAQERAQLGLPPLHRAQWVESINDVFTRAQREHTTLLVGGITAATDQLLAANLRGMGYLADALPVADNEAFRQGKAFCNRGMCNPAYFTVGTLLHTLDEIRAAHGLTHKEVGERYLHITANSCGACRFGQYVNEYRKALTAGGYTNFRVLLLGQNMIENEDRIGGNGFEVNGGLVYRLIQSIMLGDIINLLKYRVRPYETHAGATDAAVEAAIGHIARALERKTSLRAALRAVRGAFAAVPVDRTQVRPKVALFGEIWGMTTEGDGNYRMQQFLESEWAEVEIQPLTGWLLVMLWEKRYDVSTRKHLRQHDVAGAGLKGKGIGRIIWLARIFDLIMRMKFGWYARLAGLHGYRLTRPGKLARMAAPYYDLNHRAGEMFMEVGKLLDYVTHDKANMMVSVKPFGCMPSSGVSDGVQSLLTEKHPSAIFIPVETTGDGAVNIYSRLQMQLFKARQVAQESHRAALAQYGMDEAEMRAYLALHPELNSPLHKPPHRVACTAANLAHQVGRRSRLWRWLRLMARGARPSISSDA